MEPFYFVGKHIYRRYILTAKAATLGLPLDSDERSLVKIGNDAAHRANYEVD